MGYMCSLCLSGFRQVSYCGGFIEGSGDMGFWIWLVGFEGNEGSGCVSCEAGKGVCLESSCGIRGGMKIGSC